MSRKDVETVNAERALADTRAEIARLTEEIRALERRSERIANFIEMKSEFAGPTTGENEQEQPNAAEPDVEHAIGDVGQRGSAATSGSGTVDRKRGRPRSPQIEAVIEVLESRQGPMPTRLIVAELRRRGAPVPRKNPVSNLASTLGRQKIMFVFQGRAQGWALV